MDWHSIFIGAMCGYGLACLVGIERRLKRIAEILERQNPHA